MVIFQLGEETEGIAFLFSGIEEDNLVAESLVEFLVFVEQRTGAQVRVHIADAVQENVRAAVFVDLADVFHDTAVEMLHETLAVGFDNEGFFNSLCLLALDACIIIQTGGVLVAKRTTLEVGAELLIDVQSQNIDIVDGAENFLLDVRYLLTHLILLLRGVQIDEEVVEKVSVRGILELLTAKLIVKLLYGHVLHRARLLMVSISYAGMKQAWRNQSSPS